MKIPASGALTGRAVEEWIGATPDAKPPQYVVDRLFLRQNGRCAITGRKMFPHDEKHTDHKKRLKDGGQNRESNLQIVLAEPHRDKTAAENKNGAKERRTRLKHQGLYPKTCRPIPSRPFPKTRPEADPDT